VTTKKGLAVIMKQKVPDWLIGLILTLFFLFITSTGIFDFTNAIEMKSFDLRARVAASGDKNPDIELVVITDDDLLELGPFPWPRHILARGVQNLALAGAKVIALNLLFIEPEKSAELTAVGRLRESFEMSCLAQEDAGLAFYEEILQALIDLDNDTKLREAIEKAGNVVLPVFFDILRAHRDQEVPQFINKHAFKQIKGVDPEGAALSLVWLPNLRPVLPSFAEAAAGVGHINLFPDQDGYIRKQVHVLGCLSDTYFPSFPMAIVKLFKGLGDDDITVVLGEGINLSVSPSSVIKVPVVDSQMRTLMSWSQGPGKAFHQTPFTQVYNNQAKTSLFRDKIVIVGPAADGYLTPVAENLPGIEVVANSVTNIMNQESYSRPHWIPWAELAILIFLGLFVTFVLPRLNSGPGAFITLGLSVGYGIVGTILFFSSHIWLRITPSILLLILAYVLIISNRLLIADKTKEWISHDPLEISKLLGLSFQNQGMLDAALEEFRRLPLEEEGVKELLYKLGLNYEKRKQFSKALTTYTLIIQDGQNFKDLDQRIPKLKDTEATMIFGLPGRTHPADMGTSLEELDTQPSSGGYRVGRYEVIGEVGRGAMGLVYKGQDPKINRTVAIKTVDLSEFDDDIVGEVKARFFREAESAGLLTHPNIVTIYDCGEERNLGYIAMEYLEGEDLERYTKPDDLFPVRDTLDIIARVADALDYAHSKNVVHRDIKPANIIRVKETDEIKVTDFGIARIMSSSRTKAGIVLGTPSYMSPEQVSGKKVDGRSDIFSLGLVLFEMLTGQKPFTGEDVTSLMFNIVKERHPSARAINPKTPRVVEKIIDKALEKDLEKRYQRAGEMATHLKKVVAKIDEIVARRRSKPD
jgi:serine/threonine-protein kinase